jgi:hypothetical protein
VIRYRAQRGRPSKEQGGPWVDIALIEHSERHPVSKVLYRDIKHPEPRVTFGDEKHPDASRKAPRSDEKSTPSSEEKHPDPPLKRDNQKVTREVSITTHARASAREGEKKTTAGETTRRFNSRDGCWRPAPNRKTVTSGEPSTSSVTASATSPTTSSMRRSAGSASGVIHLDAPRLSSSHCDDAAQPWDCKCPTSRTNCRGGAGDSDNLTARYTHGVIRPCRPRCTRSAWRHSGHSAGQRGYSGVEAQQGQSNSKATKQLPIVVARGVMCSAQRSRCS